MARSARSEGGRRTERETSRPGGRACRSRAVAHIANEMAPSRACELAERKTAHQSDPIAGSGPDLKHGEWHPVLRERNEACEPESRTCIPRRPS